MTETFLELFEETVQDMYSAESQFLGCTHRMIEVAQSELLKKTLQGHVIRTQNHIDRINFVAKFLEIDPSGDTCEAAKGLISEFEKHIPKVTPGPLLDAAIILCAQRMAHYEISSYGTLIEWGSVIGVRDAVTLFESTMAEERASNDALGQAAKNEINLDAKSPVKAHKISMR